MDIVFYVYSIVVFNHVRPHESCYPTPNQGFHLIAGGTPRAAKVTNHFLQAISNTTLTFFALARVLQPYIGTLSAHQEHSHTLIAVCFPISAAHRSILSCTDPVARAFIYTSLLILHTFSITMARWVTCQIVCKQISKQICKIIGSLPFPYVSYATPSGD